MIPSQRPMMLNLALSFEQVIKVWFPSWYFWYLFFSFFFFLMITSVLGFVRILAHSRRNQGVNCRSPGTTPKNWKSTFQSCSRPPKNFPQRTESYASGTRTSLTRLVFICFICRDSALVFVIKTKKKTKKKNNTFKYALRLWHWWMLTCWDISSAGRTASRSCAWALPL